MKERKIVVSDVTQTDKALTINVNRDQMNYGQMNGGHTNGFQLNNNQSVGGQMNGNQFNSGQMNGGHTNGCQLKSTQNVEKNLIGNQINSGEMNGGQTKEVQLSSTQSVGRDITGQQINSGEMNGGQTKEVRLSSTQSVGRDIITGHQTNSAWMNVGQTNGFKLKHDQSVGGQIKRCELNNSQRVRDQINRGQANEKQCHFEWNGGQTNTGWMIFVRDLKIEHSEKYKNWKWDNDSSGAIESLWFRARRNFPALSANTKYGAYLIFKTTQDSEGLDAIQKAVVSVGRKEFTKQVYLKPPTFKSHGVGLPVERSDGWMELELGQFDCDNATGDKDVVISIEETKTDNKKTGLILEGIEIRPI